MIGHLPEARRKPTKEKVSQLTFQRRAFLRARWRTCKRKEGKYQTYLKDEDLAMNGRPVEDTEADLQGKVVKTYLKP